MGGVDVEVLDRGADVISWEVAEGSRGGGVTSTGVL